jgi:hypothetical protein
LLNETSLDLGGSQKYIYGVEADWRLVTFNSSLACEFSVAREGGKAGRLSILLEGSKSQFVTSQRGGHWLFLSLSKIGRITYMDECKYH